MLQVNKQFSLSLGRLRGRIWPGVVLLIVATNGYAQTITKSNPPTTQTPSTVGRIVKWAAVDGSGKGIVGDSVITESAGNITVGGDISTGGTVSGNTVSATTLNVSGNATAGGTVSGNTINATTLNVSGNATAGGTVSGNIVNATTQYNIGGFRILSNAGSNNLFAGVGAGENNTGGGNAFFGDGAGRFNTAGSLNSFFGLEAGGDNKGHLNSFFGIEAGEVNEADKNSFFGAFAGGSNTTGNSNSFFGAEAGDLNTTGSGNSIFGFQAGTNNIVGRDNSFFGREAGKTNNGINNSFFGSFAGRNNSTGSGNNFFGEEAGEGNTTGGGNNFFGVETGQGTTTGGDNSFFGDNAGTSNITGSDNTLIGAGTNVLSGNLSHATAIGADAKVLFSNFIVLGRTLGEDTVQVPGDLIVGGNVTKGSGSFKIDHPLDPANKTLSHSFVESPDMMNIYNGNITTDGKGEAMVSLPEYFAALNRDFRYQLTVIGQFAQAIVASEIKDNCFAIKTDKPNVKVSWQVTGVRQDAYANANRIQVVEDKGGQRGTYLHPKLFNPAAARSSSGPR